MRIKEKIVRNLMSGNFIHRIIKKIDLYIQSVTRRHFGKFIKVQNDKILFINFQGAYTCNQKAIADEIIRQKLPYKMVFAVLKENMKKPTVINSFPGQVDIVQRGTYDFFVEAASSKIWIDNSVNMGYLNARKKKEQVVIQTWHGSLGLKKMTKAAVQNKKWVRKATKYGKKTDYCISNSKFETELVYRNNYWSGSQILEYGHPRNDILFNKESKEAKEIEENVRKYYNIPKEKKILLYAPTFREDKKTSYYNINYEKLRVALEEKFGGEWVILVRFHFKLRKVLNLTKFDENIINATDYDDMQNLIVVCDMGITDYSSWICDLVLTQKPGFIYAPDLEKYNEERGLFYPLSETPFPISKDNEELLNNVKKFDAKKYEEKRKQFLEKRGCIEDGKASQRVVEKIKEIINNGEKKV